MLGPGPWGLPYSTRRRERTMEMVSLEGTGRLWLVEPATRRPSLLQQAGWWSLLRCVRPTNCAPDLCLPRMPHEEQKEQLENRNN